MKLLKSIGVILLALLVSYGCLYSTIIITRNMYGADEVLVPLFLLGQMLLASASITSLGLGILWVVHICKK